MIPLFLPQGHPPIEGVASLLLSSSHVSSIEVSKLKLSQPYLFSKRLSNE